MKSLLRLLTPRRLAAALCTVACATAAIAQTFTINGTNFTYSDSQRTFPGIFVKPPGNGPFPAIIINHGQPSMPSDYSLTKANEMAAWGLVCIGPQLTHSSAEGDFSASGSGNSPENVARGQACLWALASLGYVDMSRVAIWGHSKGSYAAIGQAGAMGSAIRAAGLSAGGSSVGGNGATQAVPSEAEAGLVVTPFYTFVGATVAGDVTLATNFNNVLAGNGIAHNYKAYPGVGHNVHQDAAANTDMLNLFRGWLTTHGVLPTTTTTSFEAVAAEDGWVLELTETNGSGGSVDNTGGLLLGDDASDRQYRVVLSFNTASLPDAATIVSATLQLKRASIVGTHPFTTHGTARVDIHNSGFGGSSTLAPGDFDAPATATQVTALSNPTTNGALSTGTLNAAGRAAINKTGTTQFRVYFSTDDNDDNSADYVSFYSGNNGTAANRPQLIIQYQ